MIKGIDVSKHQGHTNGQTKINFKKLKELGYEFVFIRAGYGRVKTQKDIAFESHYQAALSAGLHIGAYHYTYAKSVAEAKTEAECFLYWIKGKKIDYPCAFDIEDSSLKSLSTKVRTDICITWLEAVKKAGYKVMLYCNADWAKNYLDMSRLSNYDLWLACYGDEAYRKQHYPKNDFKIWQHTSSLSLPEVYSSRLDEDYAYVDYSKPIVTSKPQEEEFEILDVPLRVGDPVMIKSGAKYTNGVKVPDWITKKILYVRAIAGNNITVSTLKTGAITGVVKRSDILV